MSESSALGLSMSALLQNIPSKKSFTKKTQINKKRLISSTISLLLSIVKCKSGIRLCSHKIRYHNTIGLL